MFNNCNKEKAIEKHHEDYSKPLNIKFLCLSCHRQLHKERREKLKKHKQQKSQEQEILIFIQLKLKKRITKKLIVMAKNYIKKLLHQIYQQNLFGKPAKKKK